MAMVKDSTAGLWYRTALKACGTGQRFKVVVQDSTAGLWYRTASRMAVVQGSVAWLWYRTALHGCCIGQRCMAVVQDSAAWLWYITFPNECGAYVSARMWDMAVVPGVVVHDCGA